MSSRNESCLDVLSGKKRDRLDSISKDLDNDKGFSVNAKQETCHVLEFTFFKIVLICLW